MTESEAKKYMLIEKECINRDCNRDCANCDIVQDVEDLNNAYDVAIKALERQIAKKPYKDNENGIYEKEYCPICHRSLFPNDHHCICGQTIDWSE